MKISLRLLLTEQCNLACAFCHNEGQVDAGRLLPMDPVRLREIIAAAETLGDLQIKFSGGEPTLHPRLAEYLDAASSVSDTVVISNGNDPDLLSGLARRYRFRLSLNVPTADSVRYSHIAGGGDLRRVVLTSQRVRSTGATVAFNSYWPGGTYEAASDLLDLAREVGATLKFLSPCHQDQRSERFAVLRRLLADQGYVWLDSKYHVELYRLDWHSVRLQSRWCPEFCLDARSETRSLRLESTGVLRSCLQRSGSTHGSVLDPSVDLKNVLRSALSASGVCDVHDFWVPIVNRRGSRSKVNDHDH